MTSPYANFMEERYIKRLEANENQQLKITKLNQYYHYIFITYLDTQIFY